MRRAVAILALLIALAPPFEVRPAEAQTSCLSRRDQRVAIKSGAAVRPGRLRQRLPGKLLRMDLCRGGAGLVWVVTMLQVDGRVVELVLDAQAGR